MQPSLPPGNADLRNSPYGKAPASLFPYFPKALPPKVTTGLPTGTQAQFIEAAAVAAARGAAINSLLTLRWVSLFCDGDVHPLRVIPTPGRIGHLVERLRKWLNRNDLPLFYIWVREHADSSGEHWHFACHVPPHLQPALTRFVAHLTGEAAQPRKRSLSQRTEGEFACGELGSWHLATDTRPKRKGYFLAAYLGKGEPSWRIVRGHPVPNIRKPVRGEAFGGDQPDGRYDMAQGRVEGRQCRKGRFFIANDLKRQMKRAAAAKDQPSGRAAAIPVSVVICRPARVGGRAVSLTAG